MIKDNISNWKLYSALYPGFKAAFEFLLNNRKTGLKDGRYPIKSNKIFAVVMLSQGKGFKNARLEAHRKYIDIQFVIQGEDIIGYSQIKECKTSDGVYSPEKDIVFFKNKPSSQIKLSKNDFAVFFPWDAHAPLAGKSRVKKIVVKIKA